MAKGGFRMKVDRSNPKITQTSGLTQGNVEKRVEDKEPANFFNFMEQADESNYQEKIKKLVESIFAQGEKLSKMIDVKELRIYKGYIQEFLAEVVANAHRYEKASWLDRRGRHKVHVTIRAINQELDHLTAQLMDQQKDALKILNHIQDIQGLILDLQL